MGNGERQTHKEIWLHGYLQGLEKSLSFRLEGDEYSKALSEASTLYHRMFPVRDKKVRTRSVGTGFLKGVFPVKALTHQEMSDLPHIQIFTEVLREGTKWKFFEDPEETWWLLGEKTGDSIVISIPLIVDMKFGGVGRWWKH